MTNKNFDPRTFEMHLLKQRAGWGQLKAVQTQQVYLADYDLFTQPSGYRRNFNTNIFHFIKQPLMGMHETKICPHCSHLFECKVGSITECQCYAIQLSKEERVFIEECYDGCLCHSCLVELKTRYYVFKEKYLWK